ncbi:MAG: oligoendopeptidase F, partial [Lachnospiraceae bacterium]|nr:oligoendopeptidase F [Lachnospiraceae bacterium]
MSEVKKIPLRSEIEDKYKWALEDLYKTDEDWEKEYAAVESEIGRFSEYPGKISESAKMLLSFLKLQDEVTCRFERLYVYAGQKMHQDMALSKYQGYS